ncbi:RNA-directed DNA polymerase, eukaryota, reverse transcriptase zinc-binding domain protein [Tanacetum coccineum]|uniref:RNA-directed DNA polymerase, eukaryota, reverse transcriptase zinc-binding domain protein n=1 Tax=Tanacetum coccineum TaxID=301880 RepID=A0ABQ5H5I3_9ASTR
MARVTRCSPGSLPFIYLGLTIGSNMNLVAHWQGMLDKFKNRLSTWKAILLSIGGRLTLIKAVLGSVGLYFMSIFRVPETILKLLERLRAKFFWGGDENSRKLAWIKWENILASLEKGGLGIGSLKAFNLVLLQKWRWRMVSNPNLLWVKVIKAIHEEDAGLDLKSCNTNGLWAKIVRSINFLHSSGIVPKQTLRFKVGGVWSFQWRRKVTGRGSDLLACLMDDLNHITILEGDDTFSRNIGSTGLFTVGATRNHIDDLMLPTMDIQTRWYKILPRKVNIFFWRLRLDRLPHRLNLSRRGLDITSIMCPVCSNGVESNEHIFFYCEVASNIWRLVRIWCDMSIPILNSHSDWLEWIENLQISNALKERMIVIVVTTFLSKQQSSGSHLFDVLLSMEFEFICVLPCQGYEETKYLMKRQKQTINGLIKEALLEFEAKGVKVFSLGLLNQGEELLIPV